MPKDQLSRVAAMARELMDATHFPVCSSGTSAASQTFTLTAASYWHWTSILLHHIKRWCTWACPTYIVLQEVGRPFWNWTRLQPVLVGVSWILFESQDIEILAFQCGREFYSIGFINSFRFFKAPHGHIKAPPGHLKGPLAKSKEHALLV